MIKLRNLLRESINNDIESDLKYVRRKFDKEWKLGNSHFSLLKRIPKSLYLSALAEYTKYGRVDSEKLRRIWDIVKETTISILIISAIHSNMNILNKYADITPVTDKDSFPGTMDHDWKRFIVFTGNVNTVAAVRTLQNLLSRGYSAKTSDELFLVIDSILDVVHEQGPLADWFIEGGESTLDGARDLRNLGIRVTGNISERLMKIYE